jgi:hypothetical protein
MPLTDSMENPPAAERTLRMLAFGQGKSERSIRMTLSLAFIAPPIVVAAIEGRLPREITSI